VPGLNLGLGNYPDCSWTSLVCLGKYFRLGLDIRYVLSTCCLLFTDLGETDVKFKDVKMEHQGCLPLGENCFRE
jgi:hypothetical protein